MLKGLSRSPNRYGEWPLRHRALPGGLTTPPASDQGNRDIHQLVKFHKNMYFIKNRRVSGGHRPGSPLRRSTALFHGSQLGGDRGYAYQQEAPASESPHSPTIHSLQTPSRGARSRRKTIRERPVDDTKRRKWALS
jgi:hypothetical protein